MATWALMMASQKEVEPVLRNIMKTLHSVVGVMPDGQLMLIKGVKTPDEAKKWINAYYSRRNYDKSLSVYIDFKVAVSYCLVMQSDWEIDDDFLK